MTITIGYCHKCCEHQQSLEKVSPAYRLESAEECYQQHCQCKDQHCCLRDPAKGISSAGIQTLLPHKLTLHISSKHYEENDRTDHLQRIALRYESVAQILWHCDGVSCCARKFSQTALQQISS